MEMAYGAPYYNVDSYLGRDLHLALVYIIMFVVLAVLLVKMIRGARIYSEKYSIMFLLLMFTGAWEVFYLMSRTPVKRTVIARFICNTILSGCLAECCVIRCISLYGRKIRNTLSSFLVLLC